MLLFGEMGWDASRRIDGLALCSAHTNEKLNGVIHNMETFVVTQVLGYQRLTTLNPYATGRFSGALAYVNIGAYRTFPPEKNRPRDQGAWRIRAAEAGDAEQLAGQRARRS